MCFKSSDVFIAMGFSGVKITLALDARSQFRIILFLILLAERKYLL
jgi:hypothetical protein